MPNDGMYLMDMLLASREIKELTEGLDKERFMESKLHKHSIIRLIQIIGEAARLVSSETKNAHPEIPWSQISGMRNHVIHRYFNVDLDVVWGVVEKYADELIRLLPPLVPPDDPENTNDIESP